jgi:hypothetical protein
MTGMTWTISESEAVTLECMHPTNTLTTNVKVVVWIQTFLAQIRL